MTKRKNDGDNRSPHTLSDIVTADGTRIKDGIFEGILDDRKLKYRWPCQQPWRPVYITIMEKIANYVCIHSSILTKKIKAFLETNRSQDLLFLDLISWWTLGDLNLSKTST